MYQVKGKKPLKTYAMAFITKPGVIEFRDLPLRDPTADEVMIKVHSAAICGSDLHLYKGRHPSVNLPAAVGHELMGEVMRKGSGAATFKEGDRVTIEPVISCGSCHYCLRGEYHLCMNVSFQYRKGQGAFSQYFYSPTNRTYKVSDTVTDDEATLIEPLSVALHAVKKSGLRVGETSAIIGAGAIGQIVALLSRQISGRQPIIADMNEFRVKKAIEMGARGVLINEGEDLPGRVNDLREGLVVDHVFEAVGRESSLRQSLEIVRKGGKITLLGIFEDPFPKVPVNLFVQKEISLSGSQGYAWDFDDAIKLVENAAINLKPIVTEHLQMKDLKHGFEILSKPGNEQIKVIMCN